MIPHHKFVADLKAAHVAASVPTEDEIRAMGERLSKALAAKDTLRTMEIENDLHAALNAWHRAGKPDLQYRPGGPSLAMSRDSHAEAVADFERIKGEQPAAQAGHSAFGDWQTRYLRAEQRVAETREALTLARAADDAAPMTPERKRELLAYSNLTPEAQGRAQGEAFRDEQLLNRELPPEEREAIRARVKARMQR